MVNLVIVDNPVFTQVGQSQEVMGTDRDWYLGDQQPQALQNRAPCCQSGCTHFSGGLAPLATHLRSRNRSDCKDVTVSGMERMVLWYRMSRSSELKSVHSGGNSVSLLRDMSGRKEGRKRTREIECHACLHYWVSDCLHVYLPPPWHLCRFRLWQAIFLSYPYYRTLVVVMSNLLSSKLLQAGHRNIHSRGINSLFTNTRTTLYLYHLRAINNASRKMKFLSRSTQEEFVEVANRPIFVNRTKSSLAGCFRVKNSHYSAPCFQNHNWFPLASVSKIFWIHSARFIRNKPFFLTSLIS